jgi:hypothetical protein
MAQLLMLIGAEESERMLVTIGLIRGRSVV